MSLPHVSIPKYSRLTVTCFTLHSIPRGSNVVVLAEGSITISPCIGPYGVPSITGNLRPGNSLLITLFPLRYTVKSLSLIGTPSISLSSTSSILNFLVSLDSEIVVPSPLEASYGRVVMGRCQLSSLSPHSSLSKTTFCKIPALSTYGKAAACRKGCKLPYTKLSNPVPFEFRRFGMMFFLRRPYIEILLKPLKVHAAPIILYHYLIFSNLHFHH